MAISFKNTKGKAQSNKVDSFEYKDGENTVRLVGGILPRDLCWVTLPQPSHFAFENFAILLPLSP